MSLFLPILLLGFAQPADQPVAPPAAPPQTQIQQSFPAATQSQSALPQRQTQDTSQSRQPGQQFKRLDPLEIYPSSTSDLCYTMRSYYFDRRDDLAPTPDGMSTCESGRDIAKRKAKHDHKAGFVLLNEPAK
jgi:hypothetical protein